MTLFDRILAARGLDDKSRAAFLSPEYSVGHDPFLLPDMKMAVDRLVLARQSQEPIAIYGDYDIDGLTATTLLSDAFNSFGFEKIETFIPNRFVEGYGLTIDAIEKIVASGAKLLVTVDCGSQNIKEIIKAKELGLDVIVTDHHTMADELPDAVAVINPKRSGHNYPFADLAGVGVAFKLVQALRQKIAGLPDSHEKWFLDLVALGTVCDVVTLVDENRMNVFWGLKVLAKTKRSGLKALMDVARIEPEKLNVRSIGFGLGPRMNAAGRLDTAQYALDLLMAKDTKDAFDKAQYLEELNISRRSDQDKILKQAIIQAVEYADDPVLVVSGQDWNHGIVGIVASKLLEKYKKPVFVLQEMGDESKGSARSYGDFSAAEALKACDGIITKGGGHKLAAGITLPTKNIAKFRECINDFYKSLNLANQQSLLLPMADADAELNELTEDLFYQINLLEPFGNGNPQPILKTNNLTVTNVRKMGTEGQHLKLELRNDDEKCMQFLAFNAPESYYVDLGQRVSVWYCLDINEWQGRKTVEGRLLRIEQIN